jgi:hypothetical protein
MVLIDGLFTASSGCFKVAFTGFLGVGLQECDIHFISPLGRKRSLSDER